nr:patatin-like phospholipase family protein [Zoogloeaceae bacterium]
MTDANREPVLVDLALQGGGAHGAFTWGVLDRMIEVPWLKLDGISGTSAGAMNAVVMAQGMLEGKSVGTDRYSREGAKAALENFWRKVSEAARLSPFQRGPFEILTGKWTLEYSPAFIASDIASRLFSPYDFGLQGTNPLRAVLE